MLENTQVNYWKTQYILYFAKTELFTSAFLKALHMHGMGYLAGKISHRIVLEVRKENLDI